MYVFNPSLHDMSSSHVLKSWIQVMSSSHVFKSSMSSCQVFTTSLQTLTFLKKIPQIFTTDVSFFVTGSWHNSRGMLSSKQGRGLHTSCRYYLLKLYTPMCACLYFLNFFQPKMAFTYTCFCRAGGSCYIHKYASNLHMPHNCHCDWGVPHPQFCSISPSIPLWTSSMWFGLWPATEPLSCLFLDINVVLLCCCNDLNDTRKLV